MMPRTSGGEGNVIGYHGLLNLQEQPHCTVFLTDFALPGGARRRLEKQLHSRSTRLLFLPVGDPRQVMTRLTRGGVDPRNDYVSIHPFLSRDRSLGAVEQLLENLPRGDMARLELPIRECGFRPEWAGAMIGVVSRADYREQDRIAAQFFMLLERSRPYRVEVNTPGGLLRLSDQRPWFQLCGKLRQGERRILPGGEVAYTGEGIDGSFVADGALLPSPENSHAAADARRLVRLSRDLRLHPVRLEIRKGRVIGVKGAGKATDAISKLVARDPRYGVVTELGISFNRACRRFIHRWPAASNEGRPGVHLAIGADPEREETTPDLPPLVHLDIMAANCDVLVNGAPFLRATS